MRRQRRLSLVLASMIAGFVAFLAPLAGAGAQDYPTKPVRIIVPYPPAGTTDILARIAAQKLTETLKQQFIVENKPGAGGNIGTEAVVRSAPDGYTLSMGTVQTATMNPAVYANMTYDPAKDLAPITIVGEVPNLMAVHPSNPAKTVAEFIAWAKERPKQVFFATTSAGATTHFSGELFNMATGLDMTAVHYKGSGPALQDLVAGQGVQVMFDNMPSIIGHARSGALRPLAVTSDRRSPAMPEMPTLQESGLKDYVVVSWFALFAPAKTPRPIIDKIYKTLAERIGEPDGRKQLQDLGAEPVLNDPDAFAQRIARETKIWKDVATKANIRID